MTLPASGNQGLWLSAADGGVFSFGDAPVEGSLPGQGITRHPPVAGMASTADGRGYWLADDQGGTYS